MRIGLPVPDGFALSAEAVAAFLAGAPLAPGITAGRWAVRSSAIDEDGSAASFAGQHLTRLDVGPDGLDGAVRDVAASADTPEARAYRRRMGREASAGMAVVLQRMVDAEVSGVLFTRHPVTLARELVIEAAWGLGEGVVAGLVIPDTFRLAVDGRVLERRIGHKDVAVRPSPEGPRPMPVDPALVDAPSLDDARLGQLHALASATIAACGADLDLEWAFATDGTLHLLQQRPVTT